MVLCITPYKVYAKDSLVGRCVGCFFLPSRTRLDNIDAYDYNGVDD